MLPFHYWFTGVDSSEF
jgi:hypothetical protein